MTRRLTKSRQQRLDMQLAGLRPKIMPRPDLSAQFSGDETIVPFLGLRVVGIRVDRFGTPYQLCEHILNFELWARSPKRVTLDNLDDLP